MITGVWMSADRTQLFVQFEDNSIAVVDARYEQLLDLHETRGKGPADADVLFEPEL